jgi:hypothetical protein
VDHTGRRRNALACGDGRRPDTTHTAEVFLIALAIIFTVPYLI